MSEKNLDQKGRWRSITIAFRVSPEENEHINEAVKLTGMTKQDFITCKLLDREVMVMKSPRTFKALRDKMDQIISELKRIESAKDCSTDFLETINYVRAKYSLPSATFWSSPFQSIMLLLYHRC